MHDIRPLSSDHCLSSFKGTGHVTTVIANKRGTDQLAFEPFLWIFIKKCCQNPQETNALFYRYGCRIPVICTFREKSRKFVLFNKSRNKLVLLSLNVFRYATLFIKTSYNSWWPIAYLKTSSYIFYITPSVGC